MSVQVAGKQAGLARGEIDRNGKVLIKVKFLEITESGRLRQPTCKEVRGK